jgi:ATP-binding cassette subfamily B protein
VGKAHGFHDVLGFALPQRFAVTVLQAVRILVLKGGQIIESGSSGELLARNGYYASLVRRQTNGLAAAR